MITAKQMLISLTMLCVTGVILAQSPVWQWASRAGGTNYDWGENIAVDGLGNSYSTGSFKGTATFGAVSLTSSGNSDVFICKMDPSGIFLWAKKAGGTSNDYGYGIALDGLGNCYVSGSFDGIAAFGTTALTSSGSSDAFVCKLDTNGTYLWAKRAGGASADTGYCIAADDVGNSYLTGSFRATAAFGTTSLSSSGGDDAYICKIDTNGSYLWAKKAGGSADDAGYGIAIDSLGNCYFTGFFNGIAAFNTISLTSSGYSDVFICKLDSIGSYLWAKKAGGGSIDWCESVAVDNYGNSYIVGSFYGTAAFGATSLSSSGGSDVFIFKLDAGGNFLWAKKAGGTADDYAGAISVDCVDGCYVTGSFSGNAVFGSHMIASSGSSDVFIARMDIYGSYLWVSRAGGSGADSGLALAIDNENSCYLIGTFDGSALFGATSLNSVGYYDIFVAKVYLPILSAMFTADNIEGIEPFAVSFFDASYPGLGNIESWAWLFGDGGTSTLQHPIHIYHYAGVYSVTLTITDNNGNTDTLTRNEFVTVLDRIQTIDVSGNMSMTYGLIYLEEVSNWQTLTLANTGNVNLSFSDPSFFQQPSHFEWQWEQREFSLQPGTQVMLQVRFAPQNAGIVTDTLYIANSSSNQPMIKIRLTGIGEYVPPRIPENVLVSMNGSSAVISWDAVTQNIHDSLIVPDGYLVYYNGSDDADNGPYYFLAVTTNLTHTHVRVGEFAEHMFYRVKAYKYYGRDRFDISSAKLEQGMTEIEVMDRLNNAIR